MIFDKLENAGLYKNINPGVNKILSFVKDLTPENYPTERICIDGEKLFMNFPVYRTQSRKEAVAEAHRRYIDVMYMVEGSETVYVKNVKSLKNVTKEYDPDIEALLADVDEDASEICLDTGSFLILFPDDAHAPGLDTAKQKGATVKKVVGKVLL